MNFKFKDDDYTARKIKKYNDALEPIINQGATTYRTRSQANLKIAQKQVGLPRLKLLKAIPVPNNGREDMEIRVVRGQLQKNSHFLDERYIDFDQRRLVTDPRRYLKGLLRPYKDHEVFKIRAGEHEIQRSDLVAPGLSKEFVPDTIIALMERYAAGNTVVVHNNRGHNETRELDETNDYTVWMSGLIHLTTKNQISPEAYKKRVAKRDKDKLTEKLRLRKKRAKDKKKQRKK